MREALEDLHYRCTFEQLFEKAVWRLDDIRSKYMPMMDACLILVMLVEQMAVHRSPRVLQRILLVFFGMGYTGIPHATEDQSIQMSFCPNSAPSEVVVFDERDLAGHLAGFNQNMARYLYGLWETNISSNFYCFWKV